MVERIILLFVLLFNVTLVTLVGCDESTGPRFPSGDIDTDTDADTDTDTDTDSDSDSDGDVAPTSPHEENDAFLSPDSCLGCHLDFGSSYPLEVGLDNTHPGWKNAACFESACHSDGEVTETGHPEDLPPYTCAACHGSNGGAERPQGHVEDGCTAAGCH